MYIIYRNGKKTVRGFFDNYEAARQHVRKLMRDQTYARQSRQPILTMNDLGYEIRKV